MTKEIATVYIVKYALTKGIEKKRVEIQSDGDTIRVIRVNAADRENEFYYGEDKYWHRTFAGAVEHAEKMRDARIKGLQNQIVKLENLSFDEYISEVAK